MIFFNEGFVSTKLKELCRHERAKVVGVKHKSPCIDSVPTRGQNNNNQNEDNADWSECFSDEESDISFNEDECVVFFFDNNKEITNNAAFMAYVHVSFPTSNQSMNELSSVLFLCVKLLYYFAWVTTQCYRQKLPIPNIQS